MINDFTSAQVAVRGYSDALNTELANIQTAIARIATLRQSFSANWPGLLAPQTPGEQHQAEVTATQVASGVPLTVKQQAAVDAQHAADVARIGSPVVAPVVVAPKAQPTLISSQEAALKERNGLNQNARE